MEALDHEIPVPDPAGGPPPDLAVGVRPRLLFLSQLLPYPPDTGGSVRTFNVLRLLAAAYDITFIGFFRARAHRTPPDRARSAAALGRLMRVSVHPIPQEHHRGRLLYDHARSVLRGIAYTRFAYESRAFREELRAVLSRESFSLIHLDSLDLFGYLPMLGTAPIVCAHANVESELLRRRAAVAAGGWKRRYLMHQAGLVERVERAWCPRVALNIAVSDRDRQALEAIAPGAEVTVVPNGVDVTTFAPAPEDGRDGSIVFLGGTEWFPNLDGLTFFCEEILPRLRRGGIDAPVISVGRATAEQQRDFAERHGVRLTGYVDDVRPYLARAGCVIVPLRIGGGTRLKITTAWAMGCPIVSTGIGCEGLAARDGENLLIRDTPAEFAQGVAAVLRDRDVRAQLSGGGRRTAEEVYSWEVIGRGMLEAYARVRRDPAGR